MSFNLRLRLKRSYSSIKSDLGKKDKSDWLYDNFYLIDRYYRIALANKKALSFRKTYETIEKYCEECGYEISVGGLITFLKAENRDFSYYELNAVTTLLAVCAVNKAADTLSSGDNGTFPKTVKALVSLSDPSWEEVVPEVWGAEKLLASSETEYRRFNKETRSAYRKLIAEYARKNKLSELDAVKKLVKTAADGSAVGDILFSPNKKHSLLWIIWVVMLSSVLISVGVVLFGWIAVFLSVPLVLASISLADIALSRITPVFKAPRLSLESVPDNAKTLVAVAALLTGGKGDRRVFESLERFRFMNPDKNIYFCLLADLPDSRSQFLLEDNEIIRTAHENIDRLNRLHGDSFCLFFRERVLNRSENRFGGWERKRGAVCELVSHIVRGDKSEYYGGDFIRDIKYILTLDSDTNLSVGSVRELVSVALHPVNKPRVKNNRVVSGYGIIQPSVRTELSSAYRTGFSRLISGTGGTDVYSTAEFKRSQALFGSGNFCGKGLIDVTLFDSLVNGKLPEGLVLSHDVVEGSILRTLCASDITLTDSTPGNAVSFFKRQHRWLRGDFQNLYFLMGNIITPFYKLRILATVLRHIAPVFALSALIAGCFLKNTSGLLLFLFAYSEFILPCAVSTVILLLSGSPLAVFHFFSKAYGQLVQTSSRLVFEMTSLARRACLTLHAFALSAVRLVTRRKTLEWTTAAQTERLSSSLGKYVLDGASSAVIGLIMLVFAIPPFMRFAGLLFFVYPLVSAVLARELNGGGIARPALSERQKNTLSVHAADMFRFYSDNVNEKTNYLPPDNIQFSPVSAVAMRTSPTNIGFYLVSLVAARDLRIITTDDLYNKLDETLGVIEKLEKYKGNLYNWYDLKDLSVLGNGYVSTVDSGNFIVMLVALKESLREYLDEECRLDGIISRCERLIYETDLTPMYDEKRDLFRIGISAGDGKPDGGCYDMLMSEARMTAYYAVASSIVPKNHWRSLGRTVTHKSGYLGMMSWSGTAFEYFMPQLFLPLYKDSFIYESVAFSLMVQKNENKIWGVSESGYYSFDSEMNYQYKANGIKSLALRRVASDERIISPYSTYLSLCVCGNSAMKNLLSLENRGMYGKYGLYEAIDINGESPLLVKSYMAHHVGMSIIASVNAIKDNIFVRRFMNDLRMGSANELLQEKIPTDVQIFAEDGYYEPQKHKKIERRERTDRPDIASPKVSLLSRGDLTALVSDIGHISLRCGDRILSNTSFDNSSLRFTLGVVFKRGGRAFGCAPLYGLNANFGFEQNPNTVSHIVSGKEFSGRVSYGMSDSANCFIITTRAESLKEYDVSLVFEPVLETEKRFSSHISFSRLFIESEYDESKRILYFRRRSSTDGSYTFILAVAPRDKAMKCSFLTSRENMSAFSISSPLDYAYAETDNKVGACIDPLCLLRAENSDGGKTAFIITCGETKGECERNIRLARGDKSLRRSEEYDPLVSALASSILYNTRATVSEALSSCGIGDLWSRGISGDYPRVVVKINAVSDNRIESVAEAFSVLTEACIRSELIFIVEDEDNYNRPVESSLRKICARFGIDRFMGRGGGVFILRERDVSDGFLTALKNSSCVFWDMQKESSAVPFEYKPDIRPMITEPQNAYKLPVPEDAYASRNGFFIRDGFVTDKSRPLPAPYSFILTGCRFSTVVTHGSLGYTFFDNARERRLCAFSGDAKSLDDGERIFAAWKDKKYDLCAVSNKVIFEKGRAVYCGEIEGNSYRVTVVVPPKYPVKLIRVEYDRTPLETLFEIRPVMGDSVVRRRGIEVRSLEAGESKCLLFKNAFGMTFPEGRGFAGAVGGESDSYNCRLKSNSKDNIFFLGACMTEYGAVKVMSSVSRAFFESAYAEAMQFASSMIPPVNIVTNDRAVNEMMNFFVPYQISACRFYARGSFYQSGGAYGFRDQLQDCLSVIYSSPETVRAHIIRCCAHQYVEGCVMHWWHTRRFGRVNRGIKSKCSDDLLYLPLVTADYIEKTRDAEILGIKVHYLDSPPLGNLSERYEQPQLSEIKEDVYSHCVRAFRYAYRLGKNGLILMGSCDWNDGFSLVGEKGIGESVFSSLLFIIAAEKFIPLAEKREDYETISFLRDAADRLKTAVEDRAYYVDRYARAICDDGTILGIDGCEECEIDILSQAFAALAGLDSERTKKALETAFSKLYDEKFGIFKLFSPPFSGGKTRVGYIRGYVAGIRENGGQYTHGALWGALGYLASGMNNEALAVLDCVNPASRVKDPEKAKRYKTEPYAISADVYSGEYSGRGGWSWYTGAASWYYKIMLEYVLGIKYTLDGTVFSIKPIVPYTVNMVIGDKKLKISVSERFKEQKLNGKEITFPLKLTEPENDVEIPFLE